VSLFSNSPDFVKLQEYFYKSQESLATVIDFVEEKVRKKKKEKKTKKKTEEREDEEEEEEEEEANSSTHSSPLIPASRKKLHSDPGRLLTP